MKPSKIRPKRHRTRKSKAIRRTVLLVLLLALMTTTHVVTLFPSEGMRYLEESHALPRTETVATLPAPGVRIGQMRLNACDEALLMGVTKFDFLLGWSGCGGGVVDCTKSAPIQAGMYSYRISEKDDPPQIYVFGRVEDENVERVVVTMHLPDYPEMDQTRTVSWDSAEDGVVKSGVDYRIRKGGKRYFILTDWSQNEEAGPFEYWMTYRVNDEDIQQKIEYRCWTSFS